MPKTKTPIRYDVTREQYAKCLQLGIQFRGATLNETMPENNYLHRCFYIALADHYITPKVCVRVSDEAGVLGVIGRRR